MKQTHKSKEKSRQIGFKDLIMIVKKSRIPWLWVAALFIFNLLYNRLLLSIPTTTGRLLGGDLSAGALSEALIGYGLLALLAIVQCLIRAFAYSTTTKRARFQLWGQMLKIKESFFDKIDRSEMLSAVTYDISSGIPSLLALIVAVIPDIIYVVRALIVVESYDVILLIILILFLPLKYVYMRIVGRWVYKTEAAAREKIGVLTGRLDERLKNVSLIKSFNREDEEGAKGEEYINELYKANVAIAKVSGISLSVQQGIELLQQFLLMVVAVVLLQKGSIDISQWIAFFLFSTNISSKIATLIDDWVQLKGIGGSLERSVRLYKAPKEEMNEQGKDLKDLKDYSISFEDVSFSYVEKDAASQEEVEKEALSSVSFTIPEGSKVAVVGRSGSGKSTALSLIERFYEPASGKVTLGGVPINEYQMEEYRKQIAYVPQFHQVFSGTIREALLYGNETDLPDEIILENASETGFDQYILLQTEGLQTMISGGDMMSGGQLQKLIITREKMRDSKIVLLDEPSSALDAESTQMVRDLIMEDLKDKTVVVVTHDLSYIQDMDQIILLTDGEMIASGTYPDLMDTCPAFRELVETQEVTA